MKLKKPIFEFDPTDLDGMIKIMQDYGDSEQPFGGKNENGEDITISVSKNCIVVHTYQKNCSTESNFTQKQALCIFCRVPVFLYCACRA